MWAPHALDEKGWHWTMFGEGLKKKHAYNNEIRWNDGGTLICLMSVGHYFNSITEQDVKIFLGRFQEWEVGMQDL